MTSINKKYIPLIISTAAASFMVNLDTYIINVSIPAIARDLSASTADVSWVVMSYNLMVVSLLLICGKLADKIGLKKLFITGYILFTISSLLCALSQNLPQLIISRVIQGIGASVLYAMPQAMIGKFMPKEERGKGFGYSASAAALGIMLGSPVSGLLTGLLSWHWIFLINLPVGIAVIALILKTKNITDSISEQSNTDFDLKGALISFLAVLGLTFWLNRLNSNGFFKGEMLTLLVISVFLIVYFVVHCKKTKNPLVDLNLLKDRYFSSANSAMFLISAFLAGNNFIMPFYLSDIKHLNEIQTGLLFIIYSASYMTFSLVYGKISKSYPAEAISAVSAFASFLTVVFFIINMQSTNLIFTILFFVLLGMSFSFFITSNNNYIMQQAQKNNEGAVAGLHRMTGRFGMLFGVVVFEFIFTTCIKSGFNGYTAAYICGGTLCICAAALSLICKFKKSIN